MPRLPLRGNGIINLTKPRLVATHRLIHTVQSNLNQSRSVARLHAALSPWRFDFKTFSSEKNDGLPPMDGKGPPPEEPPAGLCCMSGCANCVWLEHAKELMDYYQDGGTKAEEALKKIKDPSLKAFLKFELDALKKRP